MAANPTPTNDAELLTAIHDMARACAEHGEEIGLKINTGEVMLAALEAARVAQTEVGRFLEERGQCRKVFRGVDTSSERTLGRCRLRLVMYYGQGFSVQWEAAGFPDSSTQVPESQAARAALLLQLAGWFRMNPELESADMQVTAAACDAAHTALRTARNAVTQNKVALSQAVETRDAAFKKLRERFRSVISELTVLLNGDDARWRLFGLNLPARPSPPRPVTAAVAEWLPAAAGLMLRWESGTHATRYRVQLRRTGEPTFTNVVTVHGLEARLPNLQPELGQELQIIAANEVGEAAAYAVNLET